MANLVFAAIVIVYNPSRSTINNIHTYLPYLKHLYIWDNSKIETPFIQEAFCEKSNVTYIKSEANEGIAKPLNTVITSYLQEKFDFLLTMDQDSYFPQQACIEYFNKIRRSRTSVSANTYYRPKIELSPGNYLQLPTVLAILSGSVYPTTMFKDVGLFNELFFLDYVDYEYSCRAYLAGYTLQEIPGATLQHQLGKTKSIQIGPVKINPTHHNPTRRQSITKNRVMLMRKFPFIRSLEFKGLLVDTGKIIFFEKDKFQKIKQIVVGLWKGTTSSLDLS
jgi:rhamnosyltransferase